MIKRLLVLAFVLALGAAALVFPRQHPIPVTGAVKAGHAQAAISNANVAPSQGHTINLGEGRLLLIRPDGAQVMVHSNPVNIQPQTPVGNAACVSSQNLAGRSALKMHPASIPGHTIDLGEGRLLFIRPDGVQVMVHSNPANIQPQTLGGIATCADSQP